jgi:hypothetical protein
VLGLQAVTANGTFHAVVSEVADDHLVLQPDTGTPVTFLWRGPPLSGEFSVGEDVNCARDSSWSTVASGTRSAEISILYTNTSRHTGGTTPGGATYSSTPQCETWQALPCTVNASFTLHTTFYSLAVSQNGVSVDIPMGTTGQLGSARVTNIFNNAQGTSGSCGGVWDAVNWEMLSVIRSIGP